MNFWDSVYSSSSEYYGDHPSLLARESLRFFENYGTKTILEFGCGQGRDALFFARNGLKVRAVDFSKISVSQLRENVLKAELGGNLDASNVDLSKDFPRVKRGDVDAVYSNLFFCMPFRDETLKEIFRFAYRILPEGGLHIFSVRNRNRDNSYGKGRKVSKDTYDADGFRVRFFSEDEILSFNHRFLTIEVSKEYEEPCSLIMIFSIREAER